jgi:FAD-dependent urate hydroxylase
MKTYDAIILGAGPYGLSIATHAKQKGVKLAIFGKPLALWKDHMPQGMWLRSRWWASSLSDPDKKYTVARYFSRIGRKPGDPLHAKTFIDYALWFQKHNVPEVDETFIKTIDKKGDMFTVTLVDGRVMKTKKMVVAPGLAYYPSRPKEYDHLDKKFVSHTADNVPFEQFEGKKVVMIGGGQSGLENTALMHEAGIDVEVVMRSPHNWLGAPRRRSLYEKMRYPTAGVADGWDNWIIEHIPYLFVRLPRATKDKYLNGLGKNGPAGSHWLINRLKGVTIHEQRKVVSTKQVGQKVVVTLDDGTQIKADHIILATGYKPDVSRLPFLSADLLKQVETYNGSPVLNSYFESSVPGLFFAGFTSHSSHGPLFRFVVGTEAAAKRIAKALVR